MDTSWIFSGYFLDTKWIHIGYTLDKYPWIFLGYFRDILWTQSGYKLDTHWIHFGYISVDISWIFSEYFMDTEWIQTGYTLDIYIRGYLLDIFGIIVGYKMDAYWIHFGYISVHIPWIQNGYCYFAKHGSHSNHSRILILNICKIFSCANGQCMHLRKNWKFSHRLHNMQKYQQMYIVLHMRTSTSGL